MDERHRHTRDTGNRGPVPANNWAGFSNYKGSSKRVQCSCMHVASYRCCSQITDRQGCRSVGRHQAARASSSASSREARADSRQTLDSRVDVGTDLNLHPYKVTFETQDPKLLSERSGLCGVRSVTDVIARLSVISC